MKDLTKEVLEDVLFALKSNIKIVRQAAWDNNLNSAKRARLREVVQDMNLSIDKIEKLPQFRKKTCKSISKKI